MFHHKWLGCDTPHLGVPSLASCGNMTIGCYGGNPLAGGTKNEDALFTLCALDSSWHFALLCDAHCSCESAALVLDTISNQQASIAMALSQPPDIAFSLLHQQILDLFRSASFREQCRQVKGETACLICAQKGQWLWWLSIGDCVVYLFHPELAQLGQYALNQRQFYEWIGVVNTFDAPVPSFSSGIRELRKGSNHILMVTDGLLEFGTRPFEDAKTLYHLLVGDNGDTHITLVQERILQLLNLVHEGRGRDSATLIHWCYEGEVPGAYPTG